MKTWKLVSGILSIVLCVFVLFQSCAVGTANTIAENGEFSGTSGFFVASLMLAGGIVSIVTRRGTKGGNIAIIVLYGIASLIGLVGAGTYFTDLYVWATWCAICAVLAIINLIKNKQKQ